MLAAARTHCTRFLLPLLVIGLLSAAGAQPGEPQVSFAVIGDSGTGTREQFAVAQAMERAAEKDPFQLVLMLGDNIYGDTRDPAVLAAKYAQLAAQPGFRRLRDRVPVLATWDDHDYGENDAGGDYPMKEASRRMFCDFWGVAADSPRRSRDGIYDAVEFAAGGQIGRAHV